MLGQQYTLHQPLGEGGYSTVYKCTDRIGVRYACKVLPKAKNTRTRVQNEIQAHQRVRDSPKIVRFYDAGENDEAFYILQEWCRGGTVKDYVAEFDTYAENTVASIARGVLRGLVHLHQAGMVHRDIKPANIFLGDKSDDADVKIGDLGTAMVIPPRPHPTEWFQVEALVGTPWFLAPENLGYNYHERSDIWSVGVMVYQLLTGRMPFNDMEAPLTPSMAKIWRSILMDDPQMTGRRWESVSDEAKSFITMCLHKDYRQRPDAVECLGHPWLTQSDCNDRFKGVPLACQPFVYDDQSLMNARTCNNVILI